MAETIEQIQALFSEPNKIYKITRDIDLQGGTLTIPEGCTLDFQGGSFSNGSVDYSNIENEFVNFAATNSELQSLLLNTSDKNLTIDLQSKSFTLSSGVSMKNSRSLKVKNGEITLGVVSAIQFQGDLILENITITSDQELFFHGSTQSIKSNLVINNCIFQSTNNDRIANVFGESYKTVTITNSKFIDCGISCGSIYDDSKDQTSGEWNVKNTVYIQNCIFSWDPAKQSVFDVGNQDAITCSRFSNIFINGCSFEGVSNTAIDAYAGGKIIITNNKFVNCKIGIELKSIFRDTDMSQGQGTLYYPYSGEVLITDNMVYNTARFVSATVNIENSSTIYETISQNQGKFKNNLIISNNTIYIDTLNPLFQGTIDGIILGECFLTNVIEGNTYTNISDFAIPFFRDRFSTFTQHLQYYKCNTLICSNIIKGNSLGFLSLSHGNYKIHNNFLVNKGRIMCSPVQEINLTISNTNNLKLTGDGGTNLYIQVYKCDNISISVTQFNTAIIQDSANNTKNVSDQWIFGAKNQQGVIVARNVQGVIRDISNLTILQDQDCYLYSYNAGVNTNTICPFNNIEEFNSLSAPIGRYIYIVNGIEYYFDFDKDLWISSIGRDTNYQEWATIE